MNTQLLTRAAAVFVLSLFGLSAAGAAHISVTEAPFHFEIIGLHERVEHTFRFKNTSKAELHITNVVMTSPLMFKSAKSKISPGEEGTVTVTLGMPRIYGDYEGEVILGFRDAPSVSLPVTGKITAPIQILPIPAFFVTTKRGYENAASIDIVGNEKEPLEIFSVEHDSERFNTTLRTVKEGRHYELTLTLKGDGKTGRVSEPITISTSSKKQPLVVIEANTLIKERIYTFPDKIDLGVIRLEELKTDPRLAEYFAQNLMVYQTGGTNLQVSAETPLPFVKISAENSDLKDRSQIKIEVIPERLKAGRIESTIALRINDAEFSRLEVPFTAVIEN